MNSGNSALVSLSGSALKVIAVVSMTIDHIAYYILDQQLGMGDTWLYETMRCIDRFTFSIFAFLIIERYIIPGLLGDI